MKWQDRWKMGMVSGDNRTKRQRSYCMALGKASSPWRLCSSKQRKALLLTTPGCRRALVCALEELAVVRGLRELPRGAHVGETCSLVGVSHTVLLGVKLRAALKLHSVWRSTFLLIHPEVWFPDILSFAFSRLTYYWMSSDGKCLKKHKKMGAFCPFGPVVEKELLVAFIFVLRTLHVFVGNWHLLLHVTSYHSLLLLWGSVDFNIMLCKMRLYKASSINCVVKLILQGALKW